MRALLLLALGTVSVVSSQSISTTGRCGAQYKGLTCKGSTYGECCSKYNYCGGSSDHCGSGCQTGYGTCGSTAPKISTDGSCGGTKGFTCLGSTYGNCCKSGYCGKTSAYCGTGCNAQFGSCSIAPVSSTPKASTSPTRAATPSVPSPSRVATPSLSSPSRAATPSAPSPSQKVSDNSRCGNDYDAKGGMTCAGSRYGDCCSQYGYW